jgi:hypothetical protein
MKAINTDGFIRARCFRDALMTKRIPGQMLYWSGCAAGIRFAFRRTGPQKCPTVY